MRSSLRAQGTVRGKSQEKTIRHDGRDDVGRPVRVDAGAAVKQVGGNLLRVCDDGRLAGSI